MIIFFYIFSIIFYDRRGRQIKYFFLFFLNIFIFLNIFFDIFYDRRGRQINYFLKITITPFSDHKNKIMKINKYFPYHKVRKILYKK